ncbi:hypothetical protein [Microseira wollei]|uniref:hypothetical protein n=1 Tax=Microseira wollei TaxID=467598 RepID=UPI001CFF155D|nr:hypothetical protein [Microseira wollei]
MSPAQSFSDAVPLQSVLHPIENCFNSNATGCDITTDVIKRFPSENYPTFLSAPGQYLLR